MRLIILAFAGLLLAFASATNDKKIVCYFGSWSIYRPGKGQFDIDTINPNMCTHLIYSFAGLNFDGTIRNLDENADFNRGGFAKINNLRKINPNLKLMIAMGGWKEGETDSGHPGNVFYSKVMSDPSSRSKLIKSIVEFLVKYNFDGFDLDWEYPATRPGGSPEDKQNLVLFLKELKETFQPKGLILSAAVGASLNTAKSAYDIPQISKYLDFINMMEYDLHGTWEPQTGHNGPLYSRSSESDKTVNVDASIQYWIQQGAPAEKIVMGIPFYGRCWTLANPSNNGVNAPAVGAGQSGPYTQEAGMLGYNEICENGNQWQVVFDEEQRVPYAYKGNQWVSYDNERSIAEKGQYVNKYGLGGMMVWSIETDDFRGNCGESWPLLRAINDALGNSISSGSVVQPKPSEHTNVKREAQPEPLTPQPQYPENPAVPQSSNQNGVVCHGNEYLKDPNNCNKFFQCIFDGHNYTPVSMVCPAGLNFNGIACDWPQNVQC